MEQCSGWWLTRRWRGLSARERFDLYWTAATSVYCSTVWTYAVVVRGSNPLEASVVVFIFMLVSQFVGALLWVMARGLKERDMDHRDGGDGRG